MYVPGAPRQKQTSKQKKNKWPKWQNTSKLQKKIQLSKEEIANLSDAQFKTLVTKTLTELVEFVRKLDETMKPMLRQTKENVQGINSDAKETGTQINGVDHKEERNIQPEKNEETRIRKHEERLRNLQDILKHSNIRIIGVPEGEEEEQKIENFFFVFLNIFIDYAITVVPFPPHSTPSCPPPLSHIPPL